MCCFKGMLINKSLVPHVMAIMLLGGLGKQELLR
jgi:hypothetical protein